jgi:hypothetical protein
METIKGLEVTDLTDAVDVYKRGEWDIDGNPIVCTYLSTDRNVPIACQWMKVDANRCLVPV